MEKINLKEILGEEIFSRENIKKINTFINSETVVIDFRDVTFISRSAVDQLFNLIEDNKDLELINIHSKIKLMMEVVKRGRNNNDRKLNNAKISTTYFCDNLEEVKGALFARRTFEASQK